MILFVLHSIHYADKPLRIT